MNRSDLSKRSILLTALSYPLFLGGVVLLFSGGGVEAGLIMFSGVFLIGVNEICFYIDKKGPDPRQRVEADRDPAE
ncbi:MAG: hypothetical protein ACTHZ5_02490 [Micrococcaceae bacterium]